MTRTEAAYIGVVLRNRASELELVQASLEICITESSGAVQNALIEAQRATGRIRGEITQFADRLEREAFEP